MTLMGLDLSATASACCIVPVTWGGDWSRIATGTVGESLSRDATDEQRAIRCGTIAAELVKLAIFHGVTDAWIEGYAFFQRTSAHTLAEVGGVVRLELVRAGIRIHTANMGSARKLLLGKCPSKVAKVAAHRALRAAGSPLWSLDESDAFVCANYGLSELPGAFCFVTAEPPPKPRKRKAAACAP